jgi:hypothetical protein
MSERRPEAPGTAAHERGDGEDAARAAKARRSAWVLGVLAVFFYLGYIAWNLFRASSS